MVKTLKDNRVCSSFSEEEAETQSGVGSGVWKFSASSRWRLSYNRFSDTLRPS